MEGTIVNVCFTGFFFSDQLLNANAFRGTSVLDHLLFPDHTFYKASSAFLWLQFLTICNCLLILFIQMSFKLCMSFFPKTFLYF